jgi:hypothetical protein
MRTVEALFDEVGAALPFPYYFGENWAALDECITDLEWVPPRAGYVLVLAEADMVLDDERDALNVLRRVLTNAVTEWANPSSWVSGGIVHPCPSASSCRRIRETLNAVARAGSKPGR